MKIAINESSVPTQSLLHKTEWQFSDSFLCVLPTEKSVELRQVYLAFFQAAPWWIRFLFSLRNKLVSLVGLKTGNSENPEEQLKNFKGQVGEQLGLFKVLGRTENEILLGESDKHLDFAVSLFLNNEKGIQVLSTSTGVVFHNVWGRSYFKMIRPFHKRIVPAMIRGIVKRILLEQKNQ